MRPVNSSFLKGRFAEVFLRLAAGIALSLLLAGCDQGPRPQDDVSANGPSDQRPAPGDSPAYRTEGMAQAEASVPFGMLRSRPRLDPASGVIELRHARGEGVADLHLALAPETMELAGSDTRSSPGWYNVGPPDRRVLEATAAAHSMHYRFYAAAGEPLVLRLAWSEGAREQSFTPARGRRDLTGQFEGADGTRLFLALSSSNRFRETRRRAGGGLELHFAPLREPLELALALSTVSIDGARTNLAAATVAGNGEFGALQRAAREAWKAPLARLSVSGPPAHRQRVGLALKRVLAHYGDLADSDGRYRAPNGEVRRVVPGRHYIGNLSLDEDYRTVLPFLSLLAPDVMANIFDTMLAHQRASGRLPLQTRWGMAQASPAGPGAFAALPALAALVSRELPGISVTEAVTAALREELTLKDRWPWEDYLRLGYFPFEAVGEQSIPLSLEAAQAQYALAVIAAVAGERALAEAFSTRTVLYRQLFDFNEGLFAAKDRQRYWVERKAAAGARAGPQQAAFWLPGQFDLDGLLTLLGGRQGLTDALDEAVMDQAMEPPRWHIPWLYAWSNRPAAGQHIDRPEEPGRGTATAPEAAHFLFRTLGLYPVNPTRGRYVLGLPTVASARLQPGDQALLFEAPGLAPGQVTGTVRFNGSPLPGLDITHRRLAAGGELLFELEADGEAVTKNKPVRVGPGPNPDGRQSAGVLLGGERF